jgi:hypothetical protein
MRAQSLWYGVVLLAFGVEAARGEQPASPEPSQITSCPTVLPVTDGERSIVVPTIAPHIEAPHVASRLPTTDHEAARLLLQEKLAERDRLQREIAALREVTKTPAQISVTVKVLEINLTKLRQSGMDLTTLTNRNIDNTALGTFDALEQRNLGKVLASPTVVTTNGQRASLNVGGEFPIPQPGQEGGVKIQQYGTQLDVTAVALGDNKVRFSVRPRVSELDTSRGVEVEGRQIPAVTVRECDFSSEVEFGRSAVLSGLVQERPESVMTASGVRTEVQEIALVVVVTPEIVR